MKEFTYTIKDELGIHARPAGLLVKCAKNCKSRIQISKGEKTADALRLMAVMGMAVKQGDTVKVSIEGDTEDADMETIRHFFESNL
ncbi:HPr family phosphocarrier protein [Faecalicatena sp. AGMB00832]|uniref:HPr family phosphocarrier protein n=1 Tax=Faecalicatena faecalis TaxID=2726362 RepID=A0ABS6D1C2_9FIRM|nr:HPr family phosphocarrier protein [Faecalicatena faecalis]MBU3875390.1 HPr family phosphocarrier protein [Faecalicatena faecalis]